MSKNECLNIYPWWLLAWVADWVALPGPWGPRVRQSGVLRLAHRGLVLMSRVTLARILSSSGPGPSQVRVRLEGSVRSRSALALTCPWAILYFLFYLSLTLMLVMLVIPNFVFTLNMGSWSGWTTREDFLCLEDLVLLFLSLIFWESSFLTISLTSGAFFNWWEVTWENIRQFQSFEGARESVRLTSLANLSLCFLDGSGSVLVFQGRRWDLLSLLSLSISMWFCRTILGLFLLTPPKE